MTQPLPLPENFNPETNMLAHYSTEYGNFHQSRQAAALAAQLVANGTPQDLALAEKVIDATLACQELDPNDPHYGNFLWMREDDVVFDLNAVEFNLEHLIPMMIQHGDRLSTTLQARILESIRLGLAEIANLDVLVAYSNITVLDILNTCLGGELLGDEAIAQRGYRKLVMWMVFTAQNGAPFEYNSPTYSVVTIRALTRLARLVQDKDTRRRVQAILARLGLSAALHIHPRTGRWAGPHSRAYHPTVTGERGPEVELLRAWLADGDLPAWLSDVLDKRPVSLEVSETASTQFGYGLTTYHSPSYALGVSSTTYGGQANVCLVHYDRPGQERAGVMYTRYTLNNKWLGDFYHATDRSKSRNLIDEGQFYGVQAGARAICLYTPANDLGVCSAAKASLVWTGRDQIDEIWVGGQQINALPVEMKTGETVVIGSGGVYFAVRPLTLTNLGREAPVRLEQRGDDLVLDLYNYLGAEKSFWEMRWPGAFYKGKPQCGFYLEMAERDDFPDGRTFGETIDQGDLIDRADAPFVFANEGERLWTVSYSRDDQTLGIEVDLMRWQLKRRWTEQGELGWPMLDSAVAQETRSGKIELGQATLECGMEAGWLYANPESRCWVAGYQGQVPAPLTLTVPGGKVHLPGLAAGTLVWQDGQVTIEGTGLQHEPHIEGGRLSS